MKAFALLALALQGADAVRRKRESDAITKFIEGIPVVNYHAAYDGVSLVEEERAGLDVKWIIQMKRSVKSFIVKTLCSKIHCGAFGEPDEGGIPFLTVRTSERVLSRVLGSRLFKRWVKFIEHDSRLPEFEMRSAEATPETWGLTAIGAGKRATEGAGVNVYMVDSGVRSTHEDFGGRSIPTLDFKSGKAVLCAESDDKACGGDPVGHGTHCAGSAVGTKYGVAPKATLRVVSMGMIPEASFAVQSLDYVMTKGLRPFVVSVSLAVPRGSMSIDRATSAAVRAGVTVVVSAGNYNYDACVFSPGRVPGVINVGSIGEDGRKAPQSNKGSCVHIWAPGENIVSASHLANDQTTTMSGTSMACPHVSGAAALVYEQNPGFTPAQVLDHLLTNAVDGSIMGLSESDTNRLLYVGADAVPAPSLAPTPPRP